jgi:hypothetical protein
MNPPDPVRQRWHELIERHLLGEISGDESRELEAALAAHRELRAEFRRRCNVDAALRHEATALSGELAAPTERISNGRTSVAPRWFAWLAWRPFSAAAVGLVLGLFGASLAWAVISPGAVATAEVLWTLVNGGFETTTEPPGVGFPRATGVWSGDEVEPVRAEIIDAGVVKPREGRRMLRFVKALGEPNLPNSAASACDVFQLVDLRPLRERIRAEGASQLELTAEFLDARAQGGAPVRFTVHLYLFEGQPDQLHATWPRTLDQAVASSAAHWVNRGGAATMNAWKKVTTRCVLTAQADFAVVQLSASRLPGAKGPEPVLGEQFADAVQLSLNTQPKLRVRAVKP